MNICIYIYLHLHTYIHTCMHACMHTYMHTYIYTYIHTYIHTYTYMYMYMCIRTKSSNLVQISGPTFKICRFAPRQRPLSVGLHRRVCLLRSAMRYLHHPAAWSNPPNKNQQTSCLKPAKMGFDQTKW